MLLRRVVTLASFALLLGPAALTAQQTASVHPEPPPVANAVRRSSAIAIDGRIDEAAWAKATPITQFRQ
jgi:hypothetical protein